MVKGLTGQHKYLEILEEKSIICFIVQESNSKKLIFFSCSSLLAPSLQGGKQKTEVFIQGNRMGWSHPEISLEDLLNLIKGFVDIIILASGFQSSGLPANWDPQNIKKALQWGLFFENVLRGLNSADDCQGSFRELEAALLEMRSDPYFPQGLANLSSSSLTRARDLVLRHLIHTLPLRDAHLAALLTATAEMDLDDLQRTECDYLNAYLDKLIPQNVNTGEYSSDGHSEFTVQELLKRQNAVSCVLSVENGLDILSKSVPHKHSDDFNCSVFRGKFKSDIFLVKEEMLTKFDAWSQWKSRNLSYLLDKRTVRMVSGARLIFSAPKVQWIQVFERLKVSAASNDDDLLEILELSMLGCITSRWSHVIGHFISVSYDLHPTSKLYYEVYNLLQRRSQNSNEESLNSTENGILEFLTLLFSDQVHLLWKISPVLAASAIPSWSPLYRLYLCEIEKQFKGNSSPIRCCSCTQEGSEHSECELAERIWCLHVFHVQVSSNGNISKTDHGSF